MGNWCMGWVGTGSPRVSSTWRHVRSLSFTWGEGVVNLVGVRNGRKRTVEILLILSVTLPCTPDHHVRRTSDEYRWVFFPDLYLRSKSIRTGWSGSRIITDLDPRSVSLVKTGSERIRRNDWRRKSRFSPRDMRIRKWTLRDSKGESQGILSLLPGVELRCGSRRGRGVLPRDSWLNEYGQVYLSVTEYFSERSVQLLRITCR